MIRANLEHDLQKIWDQLPKPVSKEDATEFSFLTDRLYASLDSLNNATKMIDWLMLRK